MYKESLLFYSNYSNVHNLLPKIDFNEKSTISILIFIFRAALKIERLVIFLVIIPLWKLLFGLICVNFSFLLSYDLNFNLICAHICTNCLKIQFQILNLHNHLPNILESF